MALRAKLYLVGDIFFLILRSKIRKKMSPTKEYFAAAGGKNRRLIPPPHNMLFPSETAFYAETGRISTSQVIFAVFSRMRDTEQYLSMDSCTARWAFS